MISSFDTFKTHRVGILVENMRYPCLYNAVGMTLIGFYNAMPTALKFDV